jgi:hypothetical protein
VEKVGIGTRRQPLTLPLPIGVRIPGSQPLFPIRLTHLSNFLSFNEPVGRQLLVYQLTRQPRSIWMRADYVSN